MTRQTSSYGTWRSPLTAARLTAGALRFDHLVCDGGDLYWVEGRATEGGRSVVVRRTPDGRIEDVTPPEFNVRTRVHEYGGAAYTVHDGVVYFSNFADQRLYRQAPGSSPQPLTGAGAYYADAHADPRRQRLVVVREEHGSQPNASAAPDSAGGVEHPVEPTAAIVGVGCDGGEERVLVSGADFYAHPVLSPDGRTLAWIQWQHPNMPWDGTELWAAECRDDGSLGAARRLAGGPDESIFQPEWSPDGRLCFVSDRSGWWNLYRLDAAATTFDTDAVTGAATGTATEEGGTCLWPADAEFGKPLWTFSQRTWAFIDRNRIAATYTEHGRWRLGILQIEPRTFDPVDLPLEPTDGLRVMPGGIAFIGGSPTHSASIALLSSATGALGALGALGAGATGATGATGAAGAAGAAGATGATGAAGAVNEHRVTVLRSATTDRLEEAWISAATALTFDSEGRAVHAFYYAPRNPAWTAPDGERPPLMVLSHGGPTAASTDVLDARIQYWTTRGFGVLDVNYSGSTGFGRAYRDRLQGQWGIADVADCVNGAKHMVATGRADPARLIIRGGSAGGYTTLAALTFHNTFRAGASHYGVSDIEVLARDTHKFESRYMDSLVGPYPEARDVYYARSPLHFADRMSAALILFQGLEDKVVPPNQAEMMADAVRRKGLPVAYVPFAGEQHGFRRAENIIRALEAELYFYGAVFGFAPADAIEPVAIDNLRS